MFKVYKDDFLAEFTTLEGAKSWVKERIESYEFDSLVIAKDAVSIVVLEIERKVKFKELK